MATTVENQGFNDAPILVSGVLSTGGRYFNARDAGQLEQAYREIHTIEKGRFLTRAHLRDVPAFRRFCLVRFGRDHRRICASRGAEVSGTVVGVPRASKGN